MNDEDAVNYDEFGFLERYAASVDVPWKGRPVVRRESVDVGVGQRLSAVVWGTDEPQLVLVHGGGQNAHTWDWVALILDRPLIAVELPGHGHSDWRADQDYSPQANARAVAVMIEQLAPRAKAVVGMSLGGMTTIALASARPDLVPKMVLVDITPRSAPNAGSAQHAGSAALFERPTFDSFQSMLDATAAMIPGRSVDALLPGILHNSRRLDDGRWAWRYDDLEGNMGGAEAQGAQLWEDVSNIPAPAMVVRGGRSPYVTDADEAEFTRRHPDTRFASVEGAGHSVQSDRPKPLAQLIDDFVR